MNLADLQKMGPVSPITKAGGPMTLDQLQKMGSTTPIDPMNPESTGGSAFQSLKKAYNSPSPQWLTNTANTLQNTPGLNIPLKGIQAVGGQAVQQTQQALQTPSTYIPTPMGQMDIAPIIRTGKEFLGGLGQATSVVPAIQHLGNAVSSLLGQNKADVGQEMSGYSNDILTSVEGIFRALTSPTQLLGPALSGAVNTTMGLPGMAAASVTEALMTPVVGVQGAQQLGRSVSDMLGVGLMGKEGPEVADVTGNIVKSTLDFTHEKVMSELPERSKIVDLSNGTPASPQDFSASWLTKSMQQKFDRPVFQSALSEITTDYSSKINKLADSGGTSVEDLHQLATDYLAQGAKETSPIKRAMYSDLASTIMNRLDQETNGGLTNAYKNMSVADPNMFEKAVGVTDAFKNQLAGKQPLIDKYIDATLQSNSDLSKPSPMAVAEETAAGAMKNLQSQLKDTGSEIGAFKKEMAGEQVDPLQVQKSIDSLDSFAKQEGLVPSKSGYVADEGRSPGWQKAELAKLNEMRSQLSALKSHPTLQLLLDTLDNTNDAAKFEVQPLQPRGKLDSPSKIVGGVLADIRDKTVGPENVAKIQEYSQEAKLIKDYRAASSNGKGYSYLMKRLLTDRDRTVKPLVDAIYKRTGVNLLDEIAASKLTTDLLGNDQTKSPLVNSLKEAGMDIIQGHGLKSVISGAIGKMLVDPEKILRNLGGKVEQPPMNVNVYGQNKGQIQLGNPNPAEPAATPKGHAYQAKSPEHLGSMQFPIEQKADIQAAFNKTVKAHEGATSESEVIKNVDNAIKEMYYQFSNTAKAKIGAALTPENLSQGTLKVSQAIKGEGVRIPYETSKDIANKNSPLRSGKSALKNALKKANK
jgi:hypothetical protein